MVAAKATAGAFIGQTITWRMPLCTKTLLSALVLLAACSEDSTATAALQSEPAERSFQVESLGRFEQPWAAAFMPGTNLLFITGQKGRIWFKDVATGRLGSVEGELPEVAFGGQGGLGDIAFHPDFEVSNPGRVYLTWAEAVGGGQKRAVLGRFLLTCEESDSCRLSDKQVLWQSDPAGRSIHYGHRIAFSPDGQHIFLSAGERGMGDPAQDPVSSFGKIFRVTLDGRLAGSGESLYWATGLRNPLGLDFAPDGQLWAFDMGPRGGDELNLIKAGANYGWPEVSNGRNYSGSSIPDHDTRPEFEAPKISWTPVIAAGDLLIYDGELFEEWRGDALLAGMMSQGIVRVDIDGESATEVARYDFGQRIRALVQGPDGAIYLLEDEQGGSDGELMRLTPAT